MVAAAAMAAAAAVPCTLRLVQALGPHRAHGEPWSPYGRRALGMVVGVVGFA